MAIENYEGYFDPDEVDEFDGSDAAVNPEWESQQKKTFTAWCNAHLRKIGSSIDLIEHDFRSGSKLMQLLEVISGEQLPKPDRGKMRFHKIANVNKCLNFIETKGVKLVSIGAEDSTAKKGLLLWCQRQTAPYKNVKVENFHTSAKPDEKSMMAYLSSFYHGLSEFKKVHIASNRVSIAVKTMRENAQLKDEYKRISSDLLKWIAEKLACFSSRTEKQSLASVETAQSELRLYRGKEKPNKLQEKARLETMYNTLQKRLRLNNQPPFVPSHDILNITISVRWKELEEADKAYEKWLFEERQRMRRIDFLLNKFYIRCSIHEAWAADKPEKFATKEHISASLAELRAMIKKTEVFQFELAANDERIERINSLLDELERPNIYICATEDHGKILAPSQTALLGCHTARQYSNAPHAGKLQYHDMNYLIARYNAIVAMTKDIKCRCEELRKDCNRILPIREEIDQLQLKFAKEAVHFQKWLQNTDEDFQDAIFVDTTVELKRYKEAHYQFQNTLPETETYCQSLSQYAIEVERLTNEHDIQCAVENPYTDIKYENLSQSWANIQVAAKQRIESLQEKEEQQQAHDKVRLEFTQKVNVLNKRLEEYNTEVRKCATEALGTLEEQIAHLKELESQLASFRNIMDDLDQMSVVIKDFAPDTTSLLPAVRVELGELFVSIQQSINILESQIITRDSKGLTKDQISDLFTCFQHFDKNNSHRLDKNEFKACLVSVGHSSFDDSLTGETEFAKIMEQVDPSNRGYVTFDAFLDFMTREAVGEDTEEQIILSFKVMAGEKLAEFEDDLEGDRLLSSIDLPTVPCAEDASVGREEKVEVLPTPRAFPDFPYPTVYPQQMSLMTALYETIEGKRCGLFESPTGTGKSLSLLNASLRWLLDHNERLEKRLQVVSQQLPQLLSGSVNTRSSGIEWVSDYEKLRANRLQIEPEIENLTALQTSLLKIRDIKSAATNRSIPGLPQLSSKKANFHQVQDAESGDADPSETNSDEDGFLLDWSETTTLGENDVNGKDGTKEPVSGTGAAFCQIIYCSRTHSQLAQVLDELANCPSLYRQITCLQLASRSMLCTNSNVYRLTQQQLVNEACMQLKQKKAGCPMRNQAAVTRLSNQLLSGLSAVSVVSAVREGKPTGLLSTETKSKPLAVQVGCPYYSIKKAVPLAQLLLVPYATLLQKSTREVFNIRLKDTVIIIDEAHNLLQATTDALSANICPKDLRLSGGLIRAYQERYRTRLSPVSSLRLRQLALFTDKLAGLLVGSAEPCVLTVPQALVSAGVDHINIGDLVDFYSPSEKYETFGGGHGSEVRRHFGAKLFGFSKWMASGAADRQKQKQWLSEGVPDDKKKTSLPTGMHALLTGMKRTREASQYLDGVDQHKVKVARTVNDFTPDHLSPEDFEVAGASLFKFQHFLNTIASCEEDVRIVLKPGTSTKASHGPQIDAQSSNVASLYVTVLNPGRYLSSLVKESRSLLLVGGTMHPLEEFIDQVFLPAGKRETDVTTFTCDHVIDAKKSLAVFPLALCLPNGVPLEFTFSKRCLPPFMDACGDAVLQICQISPVILPSSHLQFNPAGMVLFLPSYDYQSCICNHWETTGLMQRFRQEKQVFREPRNADCLQKVMQAYSQSAREHGALLICVIGGKLSEGINFSDYLARTVVIVGLPYANPHCPLLREKMAYLDRHSAVKSSTVITNRASWAGSPGRRHYESLCMRAVNQAIGRAVRHAGDYAAVFLMDKRFTRTTAQAGLPAWVQKGLRGSCQSGGSAKSISLSDAISETKDFFRFVRRAETE